MPGDNKEDKKVEIQPQKPVFIVQNQTVAYDFRAKPGVYTFQISSSSTEKQEVTQQTEAIRRYESAMLAKVSKYRIPTDSDWEELRRKRQNIESDYLREQETNVYNMRLEREAQISKIDHKYAPQVDELEKRRKNRIDQIKPEVLKKFPLPEFKVNFLREDGEAVPETANRRTVSFTKRQMDNLQSIRQNERKFMFWKLKQSPEFEALQNSVADFENRFSWMQSSVSNRNAAIRMATGMMSSLATIKLNADQYLDKYAGTNYSKACNARKSMARKAAQMAENRIAQLKMQLEQYDLDMDRTKANQDREIREQTLEANAEYDQGMLPINQAKQTEMVEYDTKAAEEELKFASRLEKYRKERTEKVDVLEADMIQRREAANSIVATASFSNREGYLDFSQLPKKQQVVLSQLQMAKLMFADKNNPFADLDENPFFPNKKEVQQEAPFTVKTNLEQDPTVPEGLAHVSLQDPEKEIFKGRDQNAQIGFKDLGKLMKEKVPGMKLAYSPQAMLTLANLELFDAAMGTKREPGDYQVTLSFTKGGASIPAGKISEIDFDKLYKQGYSCVVENVRATPISVNNGKLVSFEIKPKTRPLFTGMIATETVTNLMQLNEAQVRLALPGRITNQPGAPADYMSRRLSQMSEEIRHRFKFDSLNSAASTGSDFNVLSEAKLSEQIQNAKVNFKSTSEIKLGKNRLQAHNILNSTYFDAETVKNTPEVLKNSRPRFSPTMQKIVEERRLKDNQVLEQEKTKLHAIDGMLARHADDALLKKLQEKIQQLEDLGSQARQEYAKKYLTANGISAEKPVEGEYQEFQSDSNRYDELATSVYKDVNAYLEQHKEELNVQGSPALLLAQWKEEVFPSGSLKTDTVEENARVINACASEHADFEKNFNGDIEYLASMAYRADRLKPVSVQGNNKEKNRAADKNIVLKDFSGEPLFTCTPSKEDLKDGLISNKPLFAALSAVVEKDPRQIYGMIKDNNNGTVTCKFFDSQKIPVYVTVSKKLAVTDSKNQNIPQTLVSGQKNPLWVQLMEKAFSLSAVAKDLTEPQKIDKKIKKEFLQNLKEKMNGAKLFSDELKLGTGGLEAHDILVTQKIEQHQELLLGRSLPMASKLDSRDIQECLTGNRLRSKTVNDMSALEMFDSLNYEVKSNVITKSTFNLHKLTGIPKEEHSDFLLPAARILKEATNKLRIKSAGNQKNKKSPLSTFYLEDLLECIDQVAKEPTGDMKEYMQRDIDLAAGILRDKLIDYNMHNTEPGTHLVSRHKGNYSAYANATFDLLEMRHARGDVINCTMMDISGKTFTVVDCKKGPEGKTVYLQDLSGKNAPDGGYLEMDLNQFVMMTKKMDFEISSKAVNRNEVSKAVATSLLGVARKKYPKEFMDTIDPLLSEDEKIHLIKDSEVVSKLTDRVMAHTEYLEQLQCGEDITPALEKTDSENLAAIKATLQDGASFEKSMLREHAERRQYDLSVLKKADEMKKAIASGKLDPQQELKMKQWLENSKLELKEIENRVNLPTRKEARVEKQVSTQRMRVNEMIREAQSRQREDELISKMAAKMGDNLSEGERTALKERMDAREKNGSFADFLREQSKLQNKKFNIEEIGRMVEAHAAEYDMSSFRLPTKNKDALKPGETLNVSPEKKEQLKKEAKAIGIGF